MLDVALSILSLALIYAVTSALLLRRRFTEQFRHIQREFLAIRLVSFLIWWLCAWFLPQLWHPIWWLSLLVLLLLAFSEIAIFGLFQGGENEQTGIFLSLVNFLLLPAVGFSLGDALQPAIAWNTPSSLFWTLAYVILFFATLHSLLNLSSQSLGMLIRPLSLQPQIMIPIRIRFAVMLYALIFVGATALIFTSNLDLRLWQMPIALFLVSMGWGIAIYLIANTPAKNVAFYLTIAIQILSAVCVLYLLCREYLLPNLPPATILAPNSAALIIGLLVWGTIMFIDSGHSISQLSGNLYIAADLGARMQFLMSQINKIENDERKNHLLVQFSTVTQALGSVAEAIKRLRFEDMTVPPQLTAQVESLERSVNLEIERQNIELTIAKAKDNLLRLETLRAFTQAHNLQVPHDLPAPSELEEQLAQEQTFASEGNFEPILSQAGEVEKLHVRLESLVKSIEHIQISEDLVKRPVEEVDRLQALAATADYFELGHPEIRGVVHAYQTAYQAYTHSDTEAFEAKADLSSELNAAWTELEISRMSIQEQVQEESYEWQSPDPKGVYVYIPKTLKEKETRQIVLVVTNEYSKPEVPIEFECGLTAVGKQPGSIKVPVSGQQMIRPYDFWSEAAGKGSIQVVLDEVRSGPLKIRVLPTTRQVVEDATKPILILAPLITVILVVAQIPVGTAAIYSGAATSVLTVGILVIRYLPNRQLGGFFRRK